MKNNIYLIGKMGAGKSTIGRQLARELKMDFYDTDRVLEERAGVNVSWIYDLEGEKGFHQREAELLKELTQKSNSVISTGGGTVLYEENRRLLLSTGLIIYLYADLSLQIKRTGRNQYNRPILRDTNIKERLIELSKERDPVYESIAQARFSTNKKVPRMVVKEILKYLSRLTPS